MADVSLTITATDAGAKKLLEDLRRSITGLQGAQSGSTAEASKATGALRSLGAAAERLAAAYLGLRSIQGLFRGIVRETTEAELSQGRLTAILKAAGGASGRTAQQIATLNAELAKSTLFSVHDIQNATAALATFHNIQGKTFDEALRKILDITQVMGGDLRGNAIQLGRALNEPAEGLRGLTAFGITFSTAEKKMVAEMMNANNVLGAQAVVMGAVRRSFGEDAATGANAGLIGSIRGATKAWDEFLESLGKTPQFEGPLTKFLSVVAGFFDEAAAQNANLPATQLANLTERWGRIVTALSEGPTNEFWAAFAEQAGVAGESIDEQRKGIESLGATTNAQIRRLQGQIDKEAESERGRQEAAKAAAKAALEQDLRDRRAAQAQLDRDQAEKDRARELEQFKKQMQREEEQRREKAVQQAIDDQDKVLDIQISLLKETGREADARRLELVKEFGALRARLVAEGDVWGVQLIDKLINVEVAKAKLGELTIVIQTAETQLANRVAVIEARFQAGLISPAERARELRAAYEEVLAVLELAVQKAEEFNQTQGTDESRAELDKLRATVARLRGEYLLLTNDLLRLAVEAKVTFEGDLRSALTNLLTTTDRIGNAFEKMANDIVEALRRVIAQMIATYIVSKLMEGINIAGFLGGGGGGKAAGPTWAPFAGGGAVSGPGSPTSDSIFARLSRGEYVVRAAAVDRYGVDFLDALNGLRLPPVASRGLPGFALGGPVHGVGGDSLHSTLNATFTSLDPAGTAQLLRRQAGTLARIHMNTVKYSRVFRDRR